MTTLFAAFALSACAGFIIGAALMDIRAHILDDRHLKRYRQTDAWDKCNPPRDYWGQLTP